MSKKASATFALIVTVGLGALFGMTTEPEAKPLFKSIVVFGDSISDTGNAGRFSNGSVWVERLAQRLGLTLAPSSRGGTNFAVGGALAQGGGNDSLRAQATRYLSKLPGGRADPNALYVVFGGGNDVLGTAGHPDARSSAIGAGTTIGGIVEDLAAAGATRIFVPNLPDVGRTPEVRSRGEATAEAARALSMLFNESLENALKTVEARHSVKIDRLDVFGLLETAVVDPEAFGFENATAACLSYDQAGRQCPDPSRYVFWDGVHPTAAAHGKLGDAAYRSLEDP